MMRACEVDKRYVVGARRTKSRTSSPGFNGAEADLKRSTPERERLIWSQKVISPVLETTRRPGSRWPCCWRVWEGEGTSEANGSGEKTWTLGGRAACGGRGKVYVVADGVRCDRGS